MNRFVRLVKENIVPSIVFAIIVVSCGGAWYLLHPASPHHARYSFVVAYEAIGTLSPGNRVEVRGIPCGEITKVELTEDGVYVTARVLSKTKIPVNSEFRLINSGLMGEREMCVLTGDSPNLVQDGDTLRGHYDEGTSGIVKNLTSALDDLDGVLDTLHALKDSVTVGSTGKRINRVIDKGGRLLKVGKSDVKSWLSDVGSLFDQLGDVLGKAKSTLENVSTQVSGKVDEVGPLMDRVNALLTKLNELKGQSAELLAKASKQDNTVGLALAENGKFVKDVDKLILDVNALIKDVKKQGIRVNIDIF